MREKIKIMLIQDKMKKEKRVIKGEKKEEKKRNSLDGFECMSRALLVWPLNLKVNSTKKSNGHPNSIL